MLISKQISLIILTGKFVISLLIYVHKQFVIRFESLACQQLVYYAYNSGSNLVIIVFI